MAIKFRYSNPTTSDTIRLGFNSYNAKDYKDVYQVLEVNVYYLDPAARTTENPDGRTLFATIPNSSVVRDDEGRYHADLVLSPPQFVAGTYIDSWKVTHEQTDTQSVEHESTFTVFPPLWITSPTPIIYDFSFKLMVNRVAKGAVKYVGVNIEPLVPRYNDLIKYYQNLAIVSDVSYTMTKRCGPCIPAEKDLRIVAEDVPIDHKDKCVAYFRLDTTEMDAGMYDIQFKMVFGDCVFLSDQLQLQIYE